MTEITKPEDDPITDFLGWVGAYIVIGLGVYTFIFFLYFCATYNANIRNCKYYEITRMNIVFPVKPLACWFNEPVDWDWDKK